MKAMKMKGSDIKKKVMEKIGEKLEHSKKLPSKKDKVKL